MEIREYANGKFQVWHNNEVLQPKEIVWERDYQSKHDFMYFDSYFAAESGIMQLQAKRAGERVVNVCKIEEKDRDEK